MVRNLKNNSEPVIGTISDVRLSRTANMPLSDNFSIPTRSSVAIPYIYLQTDDREYVISVRNNKQFKQLLELGPEVWNKLKVPIYASASSSYLVYADFDNMYFSGTEDDTIKDFS